jgi:outer membrane translocation and assembly module TamA
VPDYERYRLGGNRRYGVRGYDFYEIVPEGNPLYLGGRFMELLSYEITLPLAARRVRAGVLRQRATRGTASGAPIF